MERAQEGSIQAEGQTRQGLGAVKGGMTGVRRGQAGPSLPCERR